MTPQNQGKLASIGEFAKTRQILLGKFGEFGEHKKIAQKTKSKVFLEAAITGYLSEINRSWK